ncbi:MAG: LysR family transcriptional regulator [Sandaracinaceae bacterium]
MDKANLAAIDLNLLVALDALLAEQHVTRASRRLGLSQPATSNALSRLRALFDDPLLVRAGGRMRRTPRADELKPRVRAALSGVREVFTSQAAFDPTSAKGTLTIAISDYVGHVLVPDLVASASCSAPGLSLRFVAHGNRLDPNALAEGVPRVSVGFFFDAPRGLYTEPLFEERFACIGRRGDVPGRLTRKRYLAMSHVLVSQRGLKEGYVDRALAEAGEERRVRTVIPHFLAAGAVVARSGGLCTLPSRVAKLTAERLDLQVHALPFPHPSWPLVLVRHERFDADGETRWLRQQIVHASAPLR